MSKTETAPEEKVPDHILREMKDKLVRQRMHRDDTDASMQVTIAWLSQLGSGASS